MTNVTIPQLPPAVTPIDTATSFVEAAILGADGIYRSRKIPLDAFAPSGSTTLEKLTITDSDPVDLVDTDNALNLGALDPELEPHLAMSAAIIQAKTDFDTAAAFLDIQPLGGIVRIGNFLQNALNGAAVRRDSPAVLTLSDAAGAVGLGALIGFTTVLQLAGGNAGQNVRLSSTATAGGSRDFLEGDPDANVTLFYPAAPALPRARIATHATGVIIGATEAGGVTTNQDARLLLSNSSLATVMAAFGFEGGADLFIRSERHGGALTITREDAGGSVHNILTATTAGLLQLYVAGTLRMRLLSSPTAILFGNNPVGNPPVDNPDPCNLQFSGSDEEDAGWVGFAAGSDPTLELRNFIREGEVKLLSTDSSGNLYEVIRVGTVGTAPALGFFTTAPVIQPAGVPVTAADIHAALVTLGLITA